MTAYLIELSLGPVQGFIAAARRSRDLWAGSYLLSECVRAAGQVLLDADAELIYPIRERVTLENPQENSNLSNVLLAKAEVADSTAAAAIARAAQEAARDRLQEAADRALLQWRNAGVRIREDIWRQQVADALESFSGWCRVDDGDYRTAYDRTKAALGARKNTRNFVPMFAPGSEDLGVGLPKSSLDGLRESVLPKGRKHFPAKFGVSTGEQLDALGCIKRVEGRAERFTALTRMAADGWLQGLGEDEAKTLRLAYEPLVAVGYATRSDGNAGCYAGFPYDAGLLFPERVEAALAAARNAASEGEADASPLLMALQAKLRPLWKAYGTPCPYAALVVADGDRMGVFIDRATTSEQHSTISRAIAEFADHVPGIARKHRGHAIYNGGEDLMVLFPLSGVVNGARALAAAFDSAMQAVVRELLGDTPSIDDKPSLRVGAAICHVQEPLGLIRSRGDLAEKFAKGEVGRAGQGNALGLQLYVRAGHVVPWRARFDAAEDFDSLQTWVGNYQDGELSGKLVYRIRQAWLNGRAAGLDADVIEMEVRRAMEHANQRGGESRVDTTLIERIESRRRRLISQGEDPADFGPLIDELILARWLSARSAADLGREDA